MMEFIIFIFGAAVGSFLNVIIFRLETGESVVGGRSHCLKCGQVLRWYDLMPLVSFLVLRGRCRACKEKISWQYPLVEIITGTLFIFIFYLNYESRIMSYGYAFSFSMIHDSLFMIQVLFYWFIVSSLIVIFVYDLRHYIIPDAVLFPAIGAAAGYRLLTAFDFATLRSGNNLFPELVEGSKAVSPYLFSALAAAAFFLFLVLITRGRGMGLGDAKLAILLGLILGWPGILIALFLAFFSGALVGVALMAAGRKTLKSQIPFGPFLILGTLAALFFEKPLLDLVLWKTFL